MKSLATQQEIHRLEVLQAWLAAHPAEVFMETLLIAESLQQYLPFHTTLCRLGGSFPLEPTGYLGRKHSPSPLVEGRRKKSRRSSQVGPNFNDDIICPPRQSSRGCPFSGPPFLHPGGGSSYVARSCHATRFPRGQGVVSSSSTGS